MSLEDELAAARAFKQQQQPTGLAAELAAARAAKAQAAPAPAPAPVKEEEPWYEDLAEGIVASGMDTYYGAKDLFSELDDDDRATLEDWKQDAAESGWGTAGRVIGEVGQIAAPAGLLTKAMKGVNMLRKIPLAGEIAASAGHGAVKLPNEGESRTEGAVKEGVSALTGGVLAKTLGKMVKGINKTPEAQKLIDKGVPLTPGKASAGALPRTAEYLMGVTPFLARGTKELKEEALDEWFTVAMKEAAPKGVKITKGGQEGMKQLKDGFDTAYGAAWGKGVKPTRDQMVKSLKPRIDAANGMSPASGNIVKKHVKAAATVFEDFGGKGFKQVDNGLRKSIDSAAKAGDEALMDTLKGMRADLRRLSGPDVNKALGEVDSQYAKFLPLKNAAGSSSAIKNQGRVIPEGLATSIASTGKGRAFAGEAPMQDFLNDSLKTIGQKDTNVLMDFLRGLATNAASPKGAMRKGGDIVMGQTGSQKYLQDNIVPIADALRKYGVSGASVGAALED